MKHLHSAVTEIAVELVTFRKQAECPRDGCGGLMQYGGVCLTIDPPVFPHTCNRCRHEEAYRTTYPHLEYAEKSEVYGNLAVLPDEGSEPGEAKGHDYPGCKDPGDVFTSDCAHGCGCWMGPVRSGGPVGVDPHGPCPGKDSA